MGMSRHAAVRAASLSLLAACVATVAVSAHADATDAKRPMSSRVQVGAAMAQLVAGLRGHTRGIAEGAAGTIEHAVASYVPLKFHPVDEGALPPVHKGGSCPPAMANVDGRFCIDKWEGSLLERGADGKTTARASSGPLLKDGDYVARSAPGVLPQGYISAAQASKACANAGKRLCQNVEWRFACGGSKGTAHPYGAKKEPGKCHDSGRAPMMALHGPVPGHKFVGWGMAELNDPKLITLDDTLAKTGAFPECVNDYGVYDMEGNLHEWTADANGTFQGGYWLDTTQHGEGCAYRTIAHGYNYHDYSTGFRCCADVSVAP